MVAVCLLLIAGVAPVQADLNLSLLDTPDIFSSFVSVDYLAGSGAFTASGFALSLDDDGGPVNSITGGLFDISASINSSGVLAPGGTLAIDGTIPSLGFNSGTLLTGDLTVFGFPSAGSALEFLFTPTGGDAFAMYGSGLTPGGIILGFSGFSGGAWGGSFSSSFSSLSNVAPIPAPGAAILTMIGFAFVGRIKRRIS